MMTDAYPCGFIRCPICPPQSLTKFRPTEVIKEKPPKQKSWKPRYGTRHGKLIGMVRQEWNEV